MAGSITFPGPPAPAVPVEVITVIDDSSCFAEFARFPGAIDVVVAQDGGPGWIPQVGTPWWLVSPHGHRVAAVPIVCDVTSEVRDGRFEIHLAVGRRDSWLVHAGSGWLLQPTTFPEPDGVEALLVRIAEPTRRRPGAQVTFAVDQVWAPLLRGATEVVFSDVPGRPRGQVEKCIEQDGDGAPRMVVAVHLPLDPWLNVGAVYRLQPVNDSEHLVVDA